MPDLPFTYPTAPDPAKVVGQQLAEFGFDLSERDDVATLFLERLAAAGLVLDWAPEPAPLIEAVYDPMTGAQLILSDLDDPAPFAHHLRYLVCPHCLSAEHLWYDEGQATGRQVDHETTGNGSLVVSGSEKTYDDGGDCTPGLVCHNYAGQCRIDFPLTTPEGWDIEWGS